MQENHVGSDQLSSNLPEVDVVKVVLCQEYEDSTEVDVESPWALPLGNDQYQLKNFPFFFYGLSFDDVFEAKQLHDDDPRPYFVKVIAKSGHRTIRIFLKKSIAVDEESQGFLQQLSDMQCGYEGNGQRFFVINVQPQCDYEAVYQLIEQSDVVDGWEMADPVESED